MLSTVVSLEEHVATVKFPQDATQAPEIRLLAPAQVENDFGRTILSRLDDGGVMHVNVGGIAKVDQLHPTVRRTDVGQLRVPG